MPLTLLSMAIGSTLGALLRFGVAEAFNYVGGLTTFSTFSAESFLLLQRGQFGAVAADLAAHVLGALGCLALGFFLVRMATR